MLKRLLVLTILSAVLTVSTVAPAYAAEPCYYDDKKYSDGAKIFVPSSMFTYIVLTCRDGSWKYPDGTTADPTNLKGGPIPAGGGLSPGGTPPVEQ